MHEIKSVSFLRFTLSYMSYVIKFLLHDLSNLELTNERREKLHHQFSGEISQNYGHTNTS